MLKVSKQFNCFSSCDTQLHFLQCIYTYYITLTFCLILFCSFSFLIYTNFSFLIFCVWWFRLVLVVDSFETLLPLYSANCWVLLAFRCSFFWILCSVFFFVFFVFFCDVFDLSSYIRQPRHGLSSFPAPIAHASAFI